MTYCASVSWLNAEGEEGQASNPSTLTVAAGMHWWPSRSINRPTRRLECLRRAVASAMALQNTPPLALDQVWVQAGPVSTLGQAPGSGQAPDYLRALPRVIQRG
jgi:hypothetical protein